VIEALNLTDYAVVSHQTLRNLVELTAPLSLSRPTPLSFMPPDGAISIEMGVRWFPQD
jgi:hypothetical protein